MTSLYLSPGSVFVSATTLGRGVNVNVARNTSPGCRDEEGFTTAAAKVAARRSSSRDVVAELGAEFMGRIRDYEMDQKKIWLKNTKKIKLHNKDVKSTPNGIKC